jgi:serine phosphatase RsbU (regulator of sigma subunit)
VSVSTAARSAHAGDPGAAFEVVIRSVVRDPAGRSGWFGSSPDPADLSLCVGDAAGCGPDPSGMAERFDEATATLLDRGHGPRDVARRLDFEARRMGDTFASVLCCGVDRSTRSVTLLQVGHPPALALSRSGSGRFLDGGRYPPLGVGDHAGLEPVTWVLPADATLLLFTIGLVERRAVPLDVALDRLRALAGRLRHLPLADLVDGVVDGLGQPAGGQPGGGRAGDFVLVGLRTSEPDAPSDRGSPATARTLEPVHRRSV